MATVKKAKKAQRGISCPRPFKSDYEGPGLLGRMRDNISQSIQAGRDRRAERREERAERRANELPSYKGVLGKPNDRPLAIDYTNPSRTRRDFDVMGGNAQAKKGAKITKVKAKDGKWIQKAINPKHKGYCTPTTKATCTPKRKALAKTLKKMAKARKK